MAEKQIIIADSLQQFNELAADHFRNSTMQAIEKNGQALVVLSGGNTPAGLFSTLIQSPFREQIPWDAVHFFWADERWVPYDDPESNFGQAKRSLFEHVPVPAGNIHPVDTNLPVAQAAAHYQHEIKKFASSKKPILSFDWILLGMGSDGHTASLFPGSPLATNEHDLIRSVNVQYENRPAMRVTMTERLLNQGRDILFLLKGKSKAVIVQRILQGEPDPLRYPAQRIQPKEGCLTWLMDKEVARELK